MNIIQRFTAENRRIARIIKRLQKQMNRFDNPSNGKNRQRVCSQEITMAGTDPQTRNN